MKKSYKIASVLSLCFLLILTACGGNKNNSGSQSSPSATPSASGSASPSASASTPAEKVVLKIPHYKAGANVGAKFFLPQIDRFNKKYEGQYEIQIEEVPDDKYRDKIKLLWQQKKLPALVESGDREFIEQLIKNGEIYDLKPWLDTKPDLQKVFIEDSVKFNTQDGHIYTMPLAVTRPTGIYFNKEMFQKAGITKPISQMTFEEFDQACEALKKAGFTPLSLMTGENGWTTMLLGTAFLAGQPGGADVLKDTAITYDYTSPMWVSTFTEIQKWLQKYSSPNAIGAKYADAANAFLNEKAAMIANGPWMVGDFSDTTKAPAGFDQKVGFSLSPGGVGIDNVQGYSWWIPNGLSQGETDAALAFMEFRMTPEELKQWMIAEGGFAPNLPASDEVNSKVSPILGEFNKQSTTDLKVLVKAMQDVWPNQIGQSEFGRYLALLAKGSVTPEQFAKQLTQKAQQFKK
ncbi:extracellular solute-binding protein [Cohnella pontilimi]|uniref:Extracellular solute-binding protein n=1 Tax=Cohnella pontilimi TaxID=2564100 RepID=A0A4U0FDG4_9BACL|nr:extracellular solute-binding protein [Cohnella pontilimi]TJY42820.1 extracellular solute-binding protein [Cohnella pontilimi]